MSAAPQLGSDVVGVGPDVESLAADNGEIDIRVRSAGSGDPLVYFHPAGGLYWDSFLRLCNETRPFPGMTGVLEALDAAALRWGVVTNKPAHLTEPLLDRLNLLKRCACVVSGDTLPERKPHPGPLLHAMAALQLENTAGVYVGDSVRDIEAGRAAGMATVAARYGYIDTDDDPLAWGADHMITRPGELLDLLGLTG